MLPPHAFSPLFVGPEKPGFLVRLRACCVDGGPGYRAEGGECRLCKMFESTLNRRADISIHVMIIYRVDAGCKMEVCVFTGSGGG